MGYEEEIGPLRERINHLNKRLMEILAERVEVAKAIGEVKRRYGKPIVDPAREQVVYRQVKALAEEMGLSPEGMERIFRKIINLCVEAQRSK